MHISGELADRFVVSLSNHRHSIDLNLAEVAAFDKLSAAAESEDNPISESDRVNGALYSRSTHPVRRKSHANLVLSERVPTDRRNHN